jgi:hypothetical protein
MAPKEFNLHAEKHEAASSSFVRFLIVKNSEILDFPTSKLIKSVELITTIHL